MKQVKCQKCKSMNVKFRGIKKSISKKNEVKYYRQYKCRKCGYWTEINKQTGIAKRIFIKKQKQQVRDISIIKKPGEKKKNKGLVEKFKALFKKKIKK